MIAPSRPAPSARGSPRRSRVSTTTALGAVAILGSTILVPRIGPNLVVLEPVLAFVAAAGLVHLVRHGTPVGRRVTDASVPWLFVIGFATAGALFHAGFASWTLTNIAQSAYAFALFYGALGYFGWHRRDVRVFVLALAATSVFVVAALVVVDDPRERAPGLFYHSNYAGHFLVGAWLLIVSCFHQRVARLLASGLLAAGLALTASFGAITMLLAALGYATFRRLRSSPAIALVILAMVAGAWYVSYHPELTRVEEVAVTSTLSSQRFERSSSGRFDLWRNAVTVLEDAPMGVGADGLRRSGALESGKEAHNTYVAYLAERGPIGLLGLLGFGLALWRAATPDGVTRVLIVAFAAGNMVRETLHYRHMWLILALAFVVDELRGDREDAAA